MNRQRFLLCAFLLPALGLLASPSMADEIPVLLDTDIGADVDDAFALALMLSSPELDVRGVTTVAGNARTRAMLVCRFLDAVGRPGIPVAVGISSRATLDLAGMHQYGLRASPKRPVNQPAVEFMYEQLKADPGKVTLIAVGPLTNVAALLEKHPDAKPWIKQIVVMGGAIRVGYNNQAPAEAEWNIRSDVKAAQAVFASGVPLLVAPLDATTMLKLDAARRKKIFATDSLLCRHLQALYELWGKETPTLYDPVAVALLTDRSFCKIERLKIEIGSDGLTRVADGKPNAQVATSIKPADFLDWYEKRVVQVPLIGRDLPRELFANVAPENRYRFLGYPIKLDQIKETLSQVDPKSREQLSVLVRVDGESLHASVIAMVDAFSEVVPQVKLATYSTDPPANAFRVIDRRGLPARVHVFEDYETEIERRWWLSARRATDDSGHICRAMLCRNFDYKMGDRYKIHRAVIFNPVPGPPMGPNTRLSFCYKLSGADHLNVQIFSLSKGYHRFLKLTGLKNDVWTQATVDMTAARRPDGSGGALANDERIDDIQFYTSPDAELSIDDIVLYDEAPAGETEPFPARFIFTGWFDTGRQGAEWPGEFEIVPHEKPLTWDAARSIIDEKTGAPKLNVSLRGSRPLAETVRLRLRYRLAESGKTGGQSGKRKAESGEEDLEVGVLLVDSRSGASRNATIGKPVVGKWTETTVDFGKAKQENSTTADEIRFVIGRHLRLEVDDLLLYVPGR